MSEKEQAAFNAFAAVLKRGYIAQQGEHPQTIGYSLVDSPVGLAAWMLDHDPDSYAKISQAFLEGRPTGELTRDRIVDNITLYWLTASATSAARVYWETVRSLVAGFASGQPPAAVSLPAAYTVFPGELIQAPRSWVENVYPNLIYFNEVTRAATSPPGKSRSSSRPSSEPHSGRFASWNLSRRSGPHVRSRQCPLTRLPRDAPQPPSPPRADERTRPSTG